VTFSNAPPHIRVERGAVRIGGATRVPTPGSLTAFPDPRSRAGVRAAQPSTHILHCFFPPQAAQDVPGGRWWDRGRLRQHVEYQSVLRARAAGRGVAGPRGSDSGTRQRRAVITACAAAYAGAGRAPGRWGSDEQSAAAQSATLRRTIRGAPVRATEAPHLAQQVTSGYFVFGHGRISSLRLIPQEMVTNGPDGAERKPPATRGAGGRGNEPITRYST